MCRVPIRCAATGEMRRSRGQRDTRCRATTSDESRGRLWRHSPLTRPTCCQPRGISRGSTLLAPQTARVLQVVCEIESDIAGICVASGLEHHSRTRGFKVGGRCERSRPGRPVHHHPLTRALVKVRRSDDTLASRWSFRFVTPRCGISPSDVRYSQRLTAYCDDDGDWRFWNVGVERATSTGPRAATNDRLYPPSRPVFPQTAHVGRCSLGECARSSAD